MLYNYCMTKNNDYYTERNINSKRRTDVIIDGLPYYCDDFFVGIETSTTALTRLNYAYDLRIFFDFISGFRFKGKKPEDITLEELGSIDVFEFEKFISYLSCYEIDGKTFNDSEGAKKRKICTVRSLFRYLFNKNALPKNNAAKVTMPKLHDKEIIRLEVDEIVKILDAAETGEGLTPAQLAKHKSTRVRDVAMLSLFLGTGIRISELVGLNVKDIDFETNGFTVTRKGGSRTILYFSNEVAESLKAYINERNNDKKLNKSNVALFISLKNERISVRAVEYLVKKYAAIAAPLKKITPHKLRSTFGTRLYEENHDIYQVADCLGHKDVNTTRRHYAAISDESRRTAARKIVLRKDD